VAVLPFADMSPEGDQEYFTDGLTVELINKLSHVGDLRVTGRRSAFKFKGSDEDLEAIGAQLNVGAILEGSVRKSGDQVRVNAELVNVADGFQLWSETYDRTLQDIFTVQDEIASSVAQALQVTLLGDATDLQAETDVEAYNLLLQARFLMERGEVGDNARAVEALQEALEIDPDSAPIWADFGLAQMRTAFAASLRADRDSALQSAREALNRALQLDPGLAEAHSRLGWIEIQYQDFAAAEVATRRALELAPNNPVVLVNAASLEATLGNLEEASRLDRRALEHDPMDLTIISNMTYHLMAAKRLEEAEENHKRLLELNPDYYRAHGVLGEVYLQQGKLEAARSQFEREAREDYRLWGLVLVHHALGDQEESDEALAKLNELVGDERPFARARARAFRGEIDEAFRWLDKARASRDSGLGGLKTDWTLERLHDDPRWQPLLEELGLAG
jgi:TolB-like protein